MLGAFAGLSQGIDKGGADILALRDYVCTIGLVVPSFGRFVRVCLRRGLQGLVDDYSWYREKDWM